MDTAIPLPYALALVLVVGALAVAAVVLLAQGRRRNEEQLGKQIEESRARAEQLEATLERARKEQQAAAQRASAAEARVEAHEKSLADLRQTAEKHAALQASHASLQERYEFEQKRFADQQKMLQETQTRLTDAFKALSSDALRANNQSFLDLATGLLSKFQEGAQGDLAQRQKAIEELTTPIRQKLDQFVGQIHELEKVRVGAYEDLKGQVRDLTAVHLPNLHKETANLVQALRQPQARGRWGEVQLKRVVEMAGMLEHVDFVEQATETTDEGARQRPDLIVRLPGGRQIVVDAKTPLDAYLTAVESKNPDERAMALARHAQQVRNHIASLGRKSYFEQFNPSPEFVVLFVPGEAFFSAALSEDPNLIESGALNNVIPASPTTLIALLKAVAYGWRQEAIARNAQDVAELGKELYTRLTTMGKHWAKVGRDLGCAVESYNKATASLESRVMVSARRFVELRAATGDKLAELVQIDRIAGALTQLDVAQDAEVEDVQPPLPLERNAG
ncbi:MAG TPA: DNA recombination protein RmuC [Nevskiaceae bacterium]|nr:DNA recombination protein RmuC [Nevskiaceae bacterium]